MAATDPPLPVGFGDGAADAPGETRADEGSEALWALLEQIRGLWARATKDRRAPYRTPVLATVDAAGRPQARTVVLRGFDAGAGRLQIHSDSRAGKVTELAASGAAALLFWDPKRRVQARVTARATLTPPAENARIAGGLSSQAGAAYRIEPAPGAPLHSARAYRTSGAALSFQAIDFEIVELEALSLDPEGHRRAVFTFGANGAAESGAWRAP
ncbi:MAG: pyridoxamine 5'-phosphate oxidase family protein [Pseudomonadota bacterium]